ncbi:hypothetical protein J2S00_000388 [Caldalkalibacillus uzonensis]|uniref:Lipoprotein n=1 Tax=Caldalkalibacillus uzonensis TaxID=353224 RepID=A0ABU0CMH8_9BACI|nr:hypothetical protein [Caldalkalibacillus uzonensis]MDQ0337618.1 hypothetical protein [Caldalkalibacillus uzonensis]
MSKTLAVTALFILLSLTLLTACQGEQVSTPPSRSEPALTDEESKLNKHSTWMATWEKAYEDTELLKVLSEMLTAWMTGDGKERAYVIEERGEEKRLYTVRYHNVDHWELKAVENDEPLFIVENNNENVNLKHDGKKRRLSQGEVDFLLPVYHFQLLSEGVKQKTYEQVALMPSDGEWHVQVLMPGETIMDLFSGFLAQHVQSLRQVPLTDFSLMYELLIKEDDDRWRISGFTFQLQKHGDVLEELNFDFEKEIKSE